MELGSGHTAISGAGPKFDHTFKKPSVGRYFVFNSHEGLHQNKTVAVFETPLIHM